MAKQSFNSQRVNSFWCSRICNTNTKKSYCLYSCNQATGGPLKHVDMKWKKTTLLTIKFKYSALWP